MSLDAILAVDASTESSSVALQWQGCVTCKEHLEARAHAQSLLPLIDSLLLEQNVALEELDGIALVSGPGSFTGVRIAMSVVQGLAYGAGLPVFCQSSLKTMAYAAVASERTSQCSHFISVLDARMEEVYWGVYQRDGSYLREMSSPKVSGYSEFNEASSAFQMEYACAGIGRGWDVDAIDGAELEQQLSDCTPEAWALLNCLNNEPKESLLAQDAASLEPLYLRNEVAWQKRTRIRKSSL